MKLLLTFITTEDGKIVGASVSRAVDSRSDSEMSQTDCLALKLVFTVFLLYVQLRHLWNNQ